MSDFREAVEEIVARANALKPDDFKTGQEHLPIAFREVDFRAAFMTVAGLLNEVETALGAYPDVSSVEYGIARPGSEVALVRSRDVARALSGGASGKVVWVRSVTPWKKENEDD